MCSSQIISLLRALLNALPYILEVYRLVSNAIKTYKESKQGSTENNYSYAV